MDNIELPVRVTSKYKTQDFGVMLFPRILVQVQNRKKPHCYAMYPDKSMLNYENAPPWEVLRYSRPKTSQYYVVFGQKLTQNMDSGPN